MAVAISHSLKDKLLRNEVASTLSIKLVKSVELPMIAKTAGFDGILVDMKHSSFDLETTSQLCISALYAGIRSLSACPVRTPFSSRESWTVASLVLLCHTFTVCRMLVILSLRPSFSLSAHDH